jgi:glycosyltransferase involved in cell wall biosynthesis
LVRLNLGAAQLEQYTIVDLPEVACLASYCLMASLGEDRVRLFGEDQPAGPSPHVEVLPHWLIAGQERASADLVYNAHSFSEMDGRSATFYLKEVERISRRYFFHINHETRFRYRTPDSGLSLNRIGSEIVPSEQHFRLLDKQPQVFVRPENRGNRGYAYLYERTDGRPPATGATRAWLRPEHAPKRRQILLLSSSADRYGSDRAMSELAAALCRSGHRVAAALPHEGPLADVLRAMGMPVIVAPLSVIGRSVPVRHLPALMAAAIRSRDEMICAFQGFSPDVVYSNTSHVVDGPALARAFGAAHVWHLREIERVPPLARRLYGYWLLATSARVVAISEAVRSAYFGGAARRVVVVTDGVDLTAFRSTDSNRPLPTYSRERPLRLLSVGRITPWKGQDVAVKAVLALVRAGHPVHLRLAGAALTSRDEAYEARLRELSSPCPGITMEGEVDDVRPLYEWADVVIHTAVEPEPFGRVVVEAMASGCAVLATDQGGPREIIRDGIDGRLIEPGDPDQLADCLATLLSNPDEIAGMGKAARARAESFSLDATARAIDEILRHLHDKRLGTER